MNEILKVNYGTKEPTVSARDLHKELEVKYDFTRWVNSNFKEFAENVDYFGTHIDVMSNQYGGVQTLNDYDLTIDMAKHICLMSRTEKGKQCRQYLIDLEKAWNTPEQVMARAIKLADRTIEELKANNAVLIADNERMKPKEIFADAVAASTTSILIGDLAKIIKQNGVDIGQKRLFIWLRENGYLIKRKGADWNSPTQKSMELELFEVKETAVTHSDGHVSINKTTKVTGKGQQYFINKFLEKPDRT